MPQVTRCPAPAVLSNTLLSSSNTAYPHVTAPLLLITSSRDPNSLDEICQAGDNPSWAGQVLLTALASYLLTGVRMRSGPRSWTRCPAPWPPRAPTSACSW